MPVPIAKIRKAYRSMSKLTPLLLPWAATTSNALAFDIRYGFTWMNLVEYKFMEYSTKVEYQGVSVNISQNSWSFVSYLFVTQ